MTGLLIIGFYCLFWWLCWKLAGKFSKGYSTGLKMKRWAIFILIAVLPYYYYLYEKSQYDAACDSVEVFFPKHKIALPEILITNRSFYTNTKGEFEGLFDYLISPLTKVEVKLNGDLTQFENFKIYPYEGRKLSDVLRIGAVIKSKARFAFLSEYNKYAKNVTINTSFVYDFYLKKKISSFSSVSYSRGLHTMSHFLFPVGFKYCNRGNKKYELFNFTSTALLENTFSRSNGEK